MLIFSALVHPLIVITPDATATATTSTPTIALAAEVEELVVFSVLCL